MFQKVLGALCAVIVVAGVSACTKVNNIPGTQATVPATTTAEAKSASLTVVLTNDDGIGALGIDELAKAIGALDEVTVVVVAPATNQSGTGDRKTPGGAKHRPGKTASGITGTAVEGTPADTIGVALDDLGLKPDLVVSGINRGQNIGPLAKLSGTVGAALTAARRKVPAIAASAGFVEHPDYANAARIVVDWITANRDALAAHRMPTDAVVSFNVPQCTAGASHEVVKVPLAKSIPEGKDPFTTDCSTAATGSTPTNDVEALMQGYAAQTAIPVS